MPKKKVKRKTNKFVKEKEEIFESGLDIVDKYRIVLPEKIDRVIKALAGKFSTEFSILLQESDRDGANIYIEDKYYIPKQEVSGGSVDYLEMEKLDKMRHEGWNVIMHRHPTGVSSFSDADINSICSLYDISILFEGGKYPIATVRHKLDGAILLIEAEVVVARPPVKIVGIENIKEKKTKLVSWNPYDRGYSWDWDGRPFIIPGDIASKIGQTRISMGALKALVRGIYGYDESYPLSDEEAKELYCDYYRKLFYPEEDDYYEDI